MARYLQVSSELAGDVESGALSPGDELPSIREAVRAPRQARVRIGVGQALGGALSLWKRALTLERSGATQCHRRPSQRTSVTISATRCARSSSIPQATTSNGVPCYRCWGR
jgi:hypothetical protein